MKTDETGETSADEKGAIGGRPAGGRGAHDRGMAQDVRRETDETGETEEARYATARAGAAQPQV